MREAWQLFAQVGPGGGTFDQDGLSVANANHPWFFVNFGFLNRPVASDSVLEDAPALGAFTLPVDKALMSRGWRSRKRIEESDLLSWLFEQVWTPQERKRAFKEPFCVPPNIKVLVSSDSEGNPYAPNEVASLNTGLYCETVMRTRQPLLVPDALAEEQWKSNPDVRLGMISYLGFPVVWPDGQIFGTICLLDDKRNEYNEPYRKLLPQCREVLQGDLCWLTTLGNELTTQKAYLDELFALVPEAIAMVDGDGRRMRVNSEFSQIFGYSTAEATARSLHELVVPEDLRGESIEFAKRVTEGREIVNTETIRQRKDGSRVPVSMVGVPASMSERKISGWVIDRDITRRKRIEMN